MRERKKNFRKEVGEMNVRKRVDKKFPGRVGMKVKKSKLGLEYKKQPQKDFEVERKKRTKRMKKSDIAGKGKSTNVLPILKSWRICKTLVKQVSKM